MNINFIQLPEIKQNKTKSKQHRLSLQSSQLILLPKFQSYIFVKTYWVFFFLKNEKKNNETFLLYAMCMDSFSNL